MTRKEILNAEPIAYISALGGIEIKKIEYGIDDHICCVSNAWQGTPTAHKVKIYYASQDYIVLRGQRFRLSDVLVISATL